MKIWHLVAVAGVAAAAIVAIVVIPRRDTKDSEAKLRRLCTGVRMAMHDDRRAFLANDPKGRDAAYARFYESDVLYHGSQSILYCIDDKDLPQMPLRCQLDKDWKCLADLAGQIESKIR
jgi:hypothetical protein